jgi:hypothetical protein
MGYEKVFNVGSFKGWKDAGGPTDWLKRSINNTKNNLY